MPIGKRHKNDSLTVVLKMSMTREGIKNLKMEYIPARVVYVAEHPLTVEEFYEHFGEDDDVELQDGVVIQKMAAQDPHEDRFRFLFVLIVLYSEKHDAGIVRGSRTPVRITSHRARLPDILFVQKTRLHIVGQKELTSAPDLVIEILSPNDTSTEVMQRQADYEQIGVKEFWLIDQPQEQVRAFHLDDDTNRFTPTQLEANILRSKVIEGFWLRVDWLWQKPLPSVLETLKEIEGS
jgi:Uma2 family endonuclease